MKTKRWYGAILSALTLNLIVALPALAEPLTMDQAVELALRNNLSLRDQAVLVGIKQRGRDLSWNCFLPSITVNAGVAQLNNPEAQTRLAAYNPQTHANLYYTPDATSLVAGLTVQLSLNPAQFQAVAQTAIDYQNSQISHDQAQAGISLAVKKLYLQLIVLRESVLVAEKTLANAEERLRQTTVRLQSGQGQEMNLLQAQIARDKAKPNLEGYRQSYRAAMLDFQNLIGLSPDVSLELAGFPDFLIPDQLPSTDELIKRHAAGNRGIAAAEGQCHAAEGQLATQNLQLWPSLTLQYSADPSLNDPLHHDPGTLSNWNQINGKAALQLVWDLDQFIPGSVWWDRQLDLQDRVGLSRSAIQQIRDQLRNDLLTSCDALDKAGQNLATWQAIADSTQKYFELTDAAYKNGRGSFVELNDAELDHQTALLNLLAVNQVRTAAWLDLCDQLNVDPQKFML